MRQSSLQELEIQVAFSDLAAVGFRLNRNVSTRLSVPQREFTSLEIKLKTVK